MKKIIFLALFFFVFLSSKVSAQILFKYQDNLYVENAPFSADDKLAIEGTKKLYNFQTDSCGIVLIKEFNGESSPIDILNLSSGETQNFTITDQIQNIISIPVCKNGILKVNVNPGIFAVNDDVHETVYGFRLNPYSSYTTIFNQIIYKKLNPNSCGFAKIKKPENTFDDNLLRIAYLSSSSVLDDKTWNNLPERMPSICVKNIRYIPYIH